MAEIRPDEVSSIIREQLSNFKSEAELEEVGTVLQVGDGIARIYGLTKVQSGELIEFSNGTQAIVLNLEDDNVGAVLLGSSDQIVEGDTVKRTGRILILHEDTLTGGFGGEIAAWIAEHCFSDLDAPVMRCASLDTPVPFSTVLEQQFLAKARLRETLDKLLAF